MEKLDRIKELAKDMKLNYLRENASQIIEQADINDLSYQNMLLNILEKEVDLKDNRAQERRLKSAGFPVIKKIEEFDFNFQKSITKKHINRLLEMDWIDRVYNLIFLGPPGLGKTQDRKSVV